MIRYHLKLKDALCNKDNNCFYVNNHITCLYKSWVEGFAKPLNKYIGNMCVELEHNNSYLLKIYLVGYRLQQHHLYSKNHHILYPTHHLDTLLLCLHNL